MDADLQPHRDFVSLQFSHKEGKVMVVHSATREQVELNGIEWALEFDDDGFAFPVDAITDDIEHRSPSRWVDEILRRAVYLDSRGQQWLCWASTSSDGKDTMASLAAEETSFQCCTIRVQVGAAHSHFAHQCLLFELEQGGSRLHWKVADMHTVGCFDQVMKKSP